MNIYSRKQLWKIALFILAGCIFSGSLLYTNSIVRKVASEERQKAKLWVDAIQEKAKLVKNTNELFDQIKEEERRRSELWAKGIKELKSIKSPNQDISFLFEVVRNNETIPVILTDEQGNLINARNVDSSIVNHPDKVKQEIEEMAKVHPPIVIRISENNKNYLYYKDSRIFSELKEVIRDLVKTFITEVVVNSASVPVIYTDSAREHVIAHNVEGVKAQDSLLLSPYTDKKLWKAYNEMVDENQPVKVELADGQVNYIFYKESYLLKQLRYYPYIQFAAIGVFLIVAYVMFSTARKAEQNKIWVGMSKETAHQLGTPISSMMAWMELLKVKFPDEPTISEMERDIGRLLTITDRFSKVGSAPSLEPQDLKEVLDNAVGYLRKRLSKKVTMTVHADEGHPVIANINIPLFEWVIENITKNAVDAVDGNGAIDFYISSAKGGKVVIDIKDTGKGIPKSKQKSIFKPGVTSKKRGWGLGLTLVLRIVEEYHNGKIYVKESSPQRGTTFRIVLEEGGH